jgi:hypothetical protein
MHQPMDRRGFLAIFFSGVMKMVNRVLCKKGKTYNIDRIQNLQFRQKWTDN